MQRTLWNRFLFNQASILNVNIRHICKHTPILFKDKQLENNFPITSESSSKLDEARKLLPKRYKAFEDHDTEIIYDDTIDLDMILNQKQKKQKPKFQRNQEMGLRGKRGVFDIEELVELLREERFREIVTIAIPKELRYGDFMVICTGTSIKHIKNFVETFNQIYKLKKSPNDPFLNLDDRSKDWRLIDLGNINLHIFLSEAREFYDIETLWSVGREFDDKTQRIEKSVVEEILLKHQHKIESQFECSNTALP